MDGTSDGWVPVHDFIHIRSTQREAIAQEGPLHNEELGHLPETVAQGEASDRAVQLARGLRDTAAEELVQSPETFVTTGSREPELAEDHDRADESTEAEVDEEMPSLAQHRQVESSRQAQSPDDWRVLPRSARCPMPSKDCQVDEALLPMSPKCYRFNQACGIDTREA